MARKKSLPNFEKSLDELESIVTRMEDGNISLEESLKHFERGILLTRHCQDALQNAEQKIETLMNDSRPSNASEAEEPSLGIPRKDNN
ncbi:MAG: exodeoxyribonuclease VII small subunit [Gammaproteobacteria bacterium]|nr:exodeoxyribonuclease VII small subunit [Gammaproteobacteria bacterium]